jgi:mono/diheme cytochrome c family protein
MMNQIHSLQKAVSLLVAAVLLLLFTGVFAFFSLEKSAPPTSPVSADPKEKSGKSPAVLTDPVALKGKALFNDNCAACHALTDEVVVGPGLRNVHARKDEAWLLKWIKSSSQVIKSGDAYGLALYEKYNRTPMPNFGFSDAEIQSILRYIRVSGEGLKD